MHEAPQIPDALSGAEIVNAQLFTALHNAERKLCLLANDQRGSFADTYAKHASEVAPAATRALLDATQPRPELLAALALAGHLPLIQQALAMHRAQSEEYARQAMAHETPEMVDFARQMQQVAADCNVLLDRIEEHVPAWLAENEGDGDLDIDQDAGRDLDVAA